MNLTNRRLSRPTVVARALTLTATAVSIAGCFRAHRNADAYYRADLSNPPEGKENVAMIFLGERGGNVIEASNFEGDVSTFQIFRKLPPADTFQQIATKSKRLVPLRFQPFHNGIEWSDTTDSKEARYKIIALNSDDSVLFEFKTIVAVVGKDSTMDDSTGGGAGRGR